MAWFNLSWLKATFRQPDHPEREKAPPRPPKAGLKSWWYLHEGRGVEVKAATRSEARSLFKRGLGIPRKGRLPAGCKIREMKR